MEMVEGVVSLFTWINAFFIGWMPEWAIIMGWGMVTSCVSMSVYVLCSSQAKLSAVKAKIVLVRKSVMDYDDDFSNIWHLVKQLLGLSFKQVGLTLVPAMAGAVPVILILICIGSVFHFRIEYFSGAPGWLGTPEALFIASVLVASLGIKYRFKIQ